MQRNEIIPLEDIRKITVMEEGYIINNLTFTPRREEELVGNIEPVNRDNAILWLKDPANSADVPPTPDEVEAKAYLNDTDWYIIREIEEGKPIPPEVKTERARAKLKSFKGNPTYIG